MHFIYEVYQALGHDPDRLVEFVSGLYLPAVAHANAQEYGWVPEAVESFCGLMSKLEDSAPEMKAELLISAALAATKFWRRLSANERVSLKTFAASIGPLRLLLAGKPGRPKVDYLGAYKLRREERLSWSRTAQRFYNASPQLQAEFSKATFAELAGEHKRKIIDRVRHGVGRVPESASPKPDKRT